MALEESVRAHFPENGIINCMCHSTENIYNFKSSALARASDDFYPANEASHTVHIANVVYNSIFMGEIVVPDWDMFQSKHIAGGLHAAARAIGGCPVYVSDHPASTTLTSCTTRLSLGTRASMSTTRSSDARLPIPRRHERRSHGAQGVESQFRQLSRRRV